MKRKERAIIVKRTPSGTQTDGIEFKPINSKSTTGRFQKEGGPQKHFIRSRFPHRQKSIAFPYLFRFRFRFNRIRFSVVVSVFVSLPVTLPIRYEYDLFFFFCEREN
ncbi:hypothetical protein ACFXTO_042834 [Malus domestica]